MSIGKNATIGLLTNLLVLGLGILISVVLTRRFGPDQRGVYAILVTTNALLASMAALSVGTACGPLLARGRYRLGEIHTAALVLALILGAISLIATSVAFLFLRDSVFQNVPYTYLLVALLLVSPAIYQLYWTMMMIGMNRIVLMNKLALAINLGNAGLMLLTVGVLRAGLPGFLAAWSISTLVGTGAEILVAGRLERPVWPLRRVVVRDLLGTGLRLHGAAVAHYIFLRFDVYLVNALVGTAGVGVYSLATSLAEKLWLPFQTLNDSSIARIAQLPRAEAALLTAKVTRTGLLLVLGLALPFAAVSGWLIPFMYGSAFAATVTPLIILLCGTPAFATMLVLNSYILGQMERPGLLSLIAWFQLAVSIPFYLVLVGTAGIIGAATASTVTYLLALVCTLAVFLRDSHLPVQQVLLPRRTDFRDYLRVARAGLARVPLLRRYAGRLF
ncbi:MAG: hypothetical protein ACR2M0_16970 [Chloroflexia bacterium]